MNQPLDMAVNRTYSLSIAHIGKVADIAERLGISQGEVVRQAIDLLWDKLDADERSTPTQPTKEQG